jgi:hypothetical protein
MRHYLLSDQDLDEIAWDLEYHLWIAIDKLRDKFIHEVDVDEEREKEKARRKEIED